jgi:hypothetical protein
MLFGRDVIQSQARGFVVCDELLPVYNINDLELAERRGREDVIRELMKLGRPDVITSLFTSMKNNAA